MAAIDALPDRAKAPAPARPGWLRSNWGVVLAVAALAVVLWLPTPEGLSIAASRSAFSRASEPTCAAW